MEFFEILLFLLVAIVFSNVLSRYIPQVPIPLIQIALGMMFTLLPFGRPIVLETELFMVMFVAPILFYDAKMVSRRELFSNIKSVLMLAFGLVFLTVAVIGNFIYLIVPGIPLAVAYALASILSPTDAVSVISLESKVHIPHRTMLFLEGEALVNDASGLVAFHFAIAAVLTGMFSIQEASVTFLFMALGGVTIGLFAALLIIRFGLWIRKLGMEDVTVHTLIQIITPCLLYLLAESLGTSGIIAAVTGGILFGASRSWTEPATSQLKIVSDNVWAIMTFILNGLIFLLLGSQLPGILGMIHIAAHHEDVYYLLYIGLVYVSLILLRFCFVLVFWKSHFGHRQDKLAGRIKGSFILSVSAVRGAVTLAAAFSIPLYLTSGEEFPSRDTVLLIAAGVILCSLIVSAILLPLMLPRKEDMPEEQKKDIEILNLLIRTAVDAVMQKTDAENKSASHKVRIELEKLKRGSSSGRTAMPSNVNVYDQEIEDIFAIARQAEIRELDQIREKGEISQELYERIKTGLPHYRRHEYLENNRIPGPGINLRNTCRRLLRTLRQPKELRQIIAGRKDRKRLIPLLATTYIQLSKAAIVAVENQINDANHIASVSVMRSYHNTISRFQLMGYNTEDGNDYYEKVHLLRQEGIQAARDEAQRLFEAGEIERELLHRLRKKINAFETALMEDEVMEHS